MSIGDPSTARERATQTSRPTLPVAVVMTAHSGAPFLKEALDGIREQTAPAAEVIVVDDIFDHNVTAEGVQAGGARLLRHPLGLNAARNAAIVGTTQPWIAFMDTDDEWVRHKLEAQWGAIATCPDVGAVFSNCWEFDTEGVTWRALFERLPHYWAIERRAVASGVKYCEHESLVRQFLLGNFIWRSTMLVRRDLLLRVGLFDPTLAHLEDRDCWLRLLALTRMAVIEEPLMWSRSSLTHRAPDSPWEYETALDAVRLSERILADPVQYPPGTTERYTADRGRCYLNAGRFTEERGDLVQARRYYFRGWRLGGGVRPLGLGILSYFPAPVRHHLKGALSRLRTAGATPTRSRRRIIASPDGIHAMRRSDMVRRLAQCCPSAARPLVRLVAKSRFSCHWLVNALLQDLGMYDRIPAYIASLDLYVPREVLDFYLNFEPLTQQYFRQALAPGMTVVDVGAHIGYYTVLAASVVGAQGAVYAIEPCADNRRLLERNLRRRALTNVTVCPCAAGRVSQSRAFHVADSSALHAFYAHPLSRGTRTIAVQERPLDELLDPPVGVIKIDVEGAELEVLAGAENVLRRSPKLSLFVEWNPDCLEAAGCDPTVLPARLAALGFSEIRVLDDRAQRVRDLEEVLSMVRGREQPPSWYATLWATKR